VAIARGQLEAIVDALTVVLPAREPADAQLHRYFREHRNLGQRDRGLVADTVYAALRRRRFLESITPSASPREIALAALVKLQGVGVGQIESALRPGEKEKIKNTHVLALAGIARDMKIAAYVEDNDGQLKVIQVAE